MRVKDANRIPFQTLFLLVVFVFIMLDTGIALPFKTILRWVMPAALLLAILIVKNGKLYATDNVLYWLLAFVFGITVIISPQRMYSLQRWVSFLLITMMFINYFFFLRENGALYRGVDIFGCLYLAYGIVNFLFLQWGSGRARGITGNPNSLGHFANISFLFALLYYKKAEGRRRKWLVAAMIASAVCVALSASRSAAILLLVNIVVAVWLICSKKLRVMVTILAPIVIFLLLNENILEQIPGIGRLLAEENVLESREAMWLHGVNLIKQKPWLGWGYGISMSLNIEKLSFHNSYLTVGIESGLVGMALLIGFILVTLVKGIISYIQKQRIETLILLVLVCNKLVDFIGESSMTSVGSAEGFFFWGVLAWLLVESDEKAEQTTTLKKEQ